MKTRRLATVFRWMSMLFLAACLQQSPGVAALAPPMVAFQGRVTVNGVPFEGTGRFKFALLGLQGAPPSSVVVWSHDGTSGGPSGEPGTSVAVAVVRGLYSVRLGDASILGMTQPIGVNVVTNVGLQLRVWFDDGVRGVELLSPDQPLTSVGYALAAERADTARQADALVANPSFSGLATFAGNTVMGSIAATERLNVAGNISLLNDSSVFGLDRLMGYNDLWILGDPTGGPDIYIGANGRVGIGTTSLNSQATIAGPDSNGTSGVLRLESGSQTLVLDGNEIDSNGALHLNFNVPHAMTLGNGGGNVSIGSLPADQRLVVEGNIRLEDDGNITGLDSLIGYNDLKLSGDPTGGPDFLIGAAGNLGQRNIYSNVSFNIRGKALSGETQFFRIEDDFGIGFVEAQSDRDFFIVGDFFVNSGSKNFVIDHPQAPTEKKLMHNTVEGPDYYTFYQGRVTLDAGGEGWVELPEYFEALNISPQYQLTCVGGYAPVFVAEEVTNNRFKIAGGKEGLQVCWQVTAVRNDPFVRNHPYKAVVDKDPDERGYFYYPEGYGQTSAKSLHRRRPPSSDEPVKPVK